MNNKKFYIKKISSRGRITIWLVDGNKIRSELNIEFTNCGHHFDFSFIPEYEFWIDKEAVPNERRFFIEHLLTEWRLIKDGLSCAQAVEIANKKERSERKKAGDLKKITDKKGRPSVDKVRCRFLKKINDKISVWVISGRLVRSIFDINFTEGGHDLVYDYVSKKEVWLDNDLTEKERLFVILHELYERSLMERGLSYDDAHRKASKVEWQSRHDEKKLWENLSLLGWK